MKLQLGLVAVGVTACASGGHLKVDPLPPNPTPQERVALWERYRPHGNTDEVVTICQRGGGCDRTEYRVIVFGDGRIAREPEDVAPLVAPDSETVAHTRRAEHFASRANWWSAASAITVVSGIILGFAGNSANNGSELDAGLGLILVGTLVGGTMIRAEARNARNATSEAFGSYPTDLANRLHVCSSGLAVVPCESSGPPPPPP